MKTLTIGLLFILCLGLFIDSWQIRRENLCLQGLRAQLDWYQTDYIPSPPELQGKLKERGYYGGKIDGDIGTKTKEGWGRHYGDVSAARCMTRTGAPKK